MNAPRISTSVVIPCYNAAAFVADAVRSVQEQTHADIEIIVVDDGSTDGSVDVVRSIGDGIRCEVRPHRGGSAARNRGLDLARGEYVQFLDADDTLHPGKIERQIEILQNSSADFVICDWERFDENGSRTEVRYSPECAEEVPTCFMLEHSLAVSAPLHRRDNLVKIGGFNQDLPCSQERDMHLRLACAGMSFAHVPEILVSVRRREDSVSADYQRVLDQHWDIIRTAFARREEDAGVTEEERQAFAEFMARDARHLFRYAEKEKALRYFAEALRMHPSGGLGGFGTLYRMAFRFLGPVRAEAMVAVKRRCLAARKASEHS